MNDARLPGSPGTATEQVLARLQGLSEFADSFGALHASVRVIAKLVPQRVSVRQTLAFLWVLYGNALGRDVTMSDLRQYMMELEGGGSVNMGQSIAKSFQLFMEPTEQDPNALGWVQQETDRIDRRKKHLRITADGAEVALKIISTIDYLKTLDERIQGQEED